MARLDSSSDRKHELHTSTATPTARRRGPPCPYHRTLKRFAMDPLAQHTSLTSSFSKQKWGCKYVSRQPSNPSWRNWLARSTVMKLHKRLRRHREVGGSSPPEGVSFCLAELGRVGSHLEVDELHFGHRGGVRRFLHTGDA